MSKTNYTLAGFEEVTLEELNQKKANGELVKGKIYITQETGPDTTELQNEINILSERIESGLQTETLFYQKEVQTVANINTYYNDPNIIVFQELEYQDGTIQTLDSTKSYRLEFDFGLKYLSTTYFGPIINVDNIKPYSGTNHLTTTTASSYISIKDGETRLVIPVTFHIYLLAFADFKVLRIEAMANVQGKTKENFSTISNGRIYLYEK